MSGLSTRLNSIAHDLLFVKSVQRITSLLHILCFIMAPYSISILFVLFGISKNNVVEPYLIRKALSAILDKNAS